MITTVTRENSQKYVELFEEASEILSGYKRVRTYDKDITEYYYKNSDPIDFDDLFILIEGITSLDTFAAALRQWDVLYIKEGSVAPGFSPMLGITTLEEYFSWIST